MLREQILQCLPGHGGGRKILDRPIGRFSAVQFVDRIIGKQQVRKSAGGEEA